MYGRHVPVDPRPAATVLLLRDDPFEVLMVRRRRGGSFSNALVFPGGKVEDQDRDAAAAAARETFEEVGVTIDPAALHPFARWITPELEVRRFDTHFFLCAMPDGQAAIPDDDETMAVEWVSPLAAIERAEAGERSILFPTLMNLRRLAESPDVASALAAADERAIVPVLPVLQPHPEGFQITIDPAAGYGSGGHVIPGLMTRD
jgi:8-oxo-dGTP pyrophosphatase MutT (NUDIX family)